MVKHHFLLKKERLPEFKDFLRKNLPSCRFIQNPFENDTTYTIYIEMNSEDSNKFTELENKWYEQDNPQPIKKTFKEKLQNFFNFK